MTTHDPNPLALAAREQGAELLTVPYGLLDPDDAPRWLADPDMTARLHTAVEELLALCAANLEHTRLRVCLAQFSTEACATAGVTAPYYALVEAEAALFACSTMHLSPHNPLGHQVNACLAAFELLPYITQEHLLLGYAYREVMCSECCAHPKAEDPSA
ncbi:hypothetical protein [Streptacidiphilus sp. MAP5-52]|uniref:hypothetical protein n=1 Tax=Streptacidiphilus sp. MAP5-52 TaxID=3156267 RepID=UPI0035190D7B